MKELMHKLEGLMEFGGTKKDVAFLVISAAALILNLTGNNLGLPFNICWIAIILCGIPIIMEAIIGLVTEFDITADVLVSLALIASVCIGEHFAAGEVAVIMQLGGLLEDLTVARARAGIEKLVKLTPKTARVINGEAESIIPAEDVRCGDILRVLPGESIPVDGVITKGQTSINQAVMTGESLPVDKTVGDEVSSGTVNQFGAFEMKATKVGEDSSIQRMIKLVQSADAGKAKIVNLADRWAVWIVIIALSAAALTWLFTGEIIRAVTILVVFCPCSLVLATPTAIMAGSGNAARHGFLVKEGDALERMASVKKITFDKTGTLTNGVPVVTVYKSLTGERTDDELWQITASVEALSEHPLGKAIAAGYRDKGGNLLHVDNFQMVTGRGVTALVDKKEIIAGNSKMLRDHGAPLPQNLIDEVSPFFDLGATVIYVLIDGVIAGYVVLSDTIRENVSATMKSIRELDVEPVLLTGDNDNAAAVIAEQAGITEVHSNCLPGDKLRYIEEYEAEGAPVCMVGDGINDAPSLKRARVGIAMGGVGSDIAVDAADIVLINDEVREFPHLIALSQKMMRTIRQNLTFSMTLNFVAIILAITGILNPIVGALVHNAGSVIVIVNSAILLSWASRSSSGQNA